MTRGRLKIYFDGGCRPNPGRMEIAVVARGVAHVDRDAGQGDSMGAEWLALIAALRIARTIGADDFELLGDSMTVIRQARGEAKIRGEAPRRHLDTFAALAADGPMPRIRHIGRAQNLAGIALARR